MSLPHGRPETDEPTPSPERLGAPARVRADFHLHTRFSPDAVLSPRRLVERARAMGLDRIAVTDHGVIRGALEAREIDPERVIVGEEIRCRCGTELIGLFLREHIPSGLPVEETAERIRGQGGVVYAPHPFAYPRAAGRRALRALAAADLVEVFNSRAFRPSWNRAATEAAASRGLPVAAGTDSHFPWEVGRAYTDLPAFTDADGLRAALPHARAVGLRTASPLVHVGSVGLHTARWATARLRGRPDAPEAPWSFLLTEPPA